eukprot:gnl/MRDRNA2_/MRDRNA2_28495_c0_seq1.p1 gnl/MRDRNA2_/MRDRNA2_28495_c0~~gnl/MRDRNA2_/MRDRNA2_28495_c0_seq1.p1  ORF type:complete len:284 (-),score=55.22 gnl/MRDRNA2_/MRDRNA2_28495_c0_seq1:138-989(-)
MMEIVPRICTMFFNLAWMVQSGPVCAGKPEMPALTDNVSLVQVVQQLFQNQLSKGHSGADDETWKGVDIHDLHKEYYKIFKTGNRNAASHLWSSFLLDKSQEMTKKQLTYMFSGFCAVSGSIVEPLERTRYKVTLGKVGGGKQTGYQYHCCWPCICDTQDFIKVDTKTIKTKDGDHKLSFAVIGNPCNHPEELSKPFEQGSQGQSTLTQEAPELKCDNGKLHGAHVSDNGHIIISMFFDEDQSLKSIGESEFQDMCKQRAAEGYESGMGNIFRAVAKISPVNV